VDRATAIPEKSTVTTVPLEADVSATPITVVAALVVDIAPLTINGLAGVVETTTIASPAIIAVSAITVNPIAEFGAVFKMLFPPGEP
jgi:hypothetical protein